MALELCQLLRETPDDLSELFDLRLVSSRIFYLTPPTPNMVHFTFLVRFRLAA
jgi:hypothetical protein